MPMALKDNLERVRKTSGLSQTALAKVSGVSQQSISRLENGDDLTSKHLPKIARALKVSVYDLDENYAPDDQTVVVSAPILSWISAGKLTDIRSIHRLEEVEDAPKFRAIGLKPSNWIALKVSGSSMDKISPPDSIILVDCKDKRLVANACYVIEDSSTGEATYKRYRPDPMRFEPVTFSEGHETIYPDSEPKIIGRVKRTVLDL